MKTVFDAIEITPVAAWNRSKRAHLVETLADLAVETLAELAVETLAELAVETLAELAVETLADLDDDAPAPIVDEMLAEPASFQVHNSCQMKLCNNAVSTAIMMAIMAGTAATRVSSHKAAS